MLNLAMQQPTVKQVLANANCSETDLCTHGGLIVWCVHVAMLLTHFHSNCTPRMLFKSCNFAAAEEKDHFLRRPALKEEDVIVVDVAAMAGGCKVLPAVLPATKSS